MATVDERVARGRDAAAKGAWREAYDFLASVDSAELAPEDLELIGEATSWTGPTEHCIEVRERAYGAYLASGDRRSAARLALVFREPATALACGAAIQRALADHRRHHGFAPSVRIGVHTAEAIPVERGYRGKGVHAAARVGAAAEANEVVASRETAEAGRVRYSNPRFVALKGLSEPVEIVTVDWT